jgi:hypothetical protein
MLLAAALLVLVAPVAGADEVRVYTNADLESFAVASDTVSPPARSPVDDHAAWEFVQSFIEREHARIDNERALELERARTAAEIESYGRSVERYLIGYPPYYRGQRVKHRVRGYGDDTGHRAQTSVRIVPLHARPTLMDVRRAQAQRYKGVDSVPNR